MSINQHFDDTLEEELWKDSFDKIISSRPTLRELNILKNDIRVSFNMNSSVENSKEEISRERKEQTASFSTPLTRKIRKNPFKCSLSPISLWKLTYFDRSENCQELADAYNIHAVTKSISKGGQTVSTYSKKNVKRASNTDTKIAKKCKNKAFFCGISMENSNNNKTIDLDSCKISLMIPPGKWRKSLTIWKRVHHLLPEDISVGKRKSIFINAEKDSILHTKNYNKVNSYKEEVLKRCMQKEPLDFNTIYPRNIMQNCSKIGEGAFGEVFLNSVEDDDIVLKIIPIEGSVNVNGELQKKFEEILPEIIITMELSNLRISHRCTTSCFVEMRRVTCVYGKYPKHLIKLWETYNDNHRSENDHPKIFDSDQIYVVLELSFGGKDLESFVFKNAEQSYFVLIQIVLALAVGEKSYKFEHRDLHWGNILIKPTLEQSLSFKIDSKSYLLPSKGVKVTIIDYTLSRITFEECSLYNDLSRDEELFSATGDFQYEVYRLMRSMLENSWDRFVPKTNMIWLSYIIGKMMNGVKYSNKKKKKHLSFMNKLKELSSIVINFSCAYDLAIYIMESMKI